MFFNICLWCTVFTQFSIIEFAYENETYKFNSFYKLAGNYDKTFTSNWINDPLFLSNLLNSSIISDKLDKLDEYFIDGYNFNNWGNKFMILLKKETTLAFSDNSNTWI